MNGNAKDKIPGLPEGLTGQIAGFEKRLRCVETIVAFTGGLCGILLTNVLLLVSDRFWNTATWLRLFLAIAGGAAFGGFLLVWFRHWWWKRRDVRELARLVQKKHARLGDRLLGAVELANGSAAGGNISPALCRAAIRQVAEESTGYDFKEAVALRWARVLGMTFIVLLLAAAATAALFPELWWRTVVRWARPLAPVERYTFVSIDDMPHEQVVPHGEEFELCCSVSPASRWKPARAVCRFDDQPPIPASIDSGRAVFRVPGQVAPGTLFLRAGDATRNIRITPQFRPELKQLSARTVFPAYVQLPPRTSVVEGGNFGALEGSTVRFDGTVSRDLKSAFLKHGTTNMPIEVSGRHFSSGEHGVKSFAACGFEWTDRFGLCSVKPYSLEVRAVPDAAPLVDCKGPARVVAILEEEAVSYEMSAEDDYGVKEIWSAWVCTDIGGKSGQETTGRAGMGSGGPGVARLTGKFEFSPMVARVPEGSVVTLRAQATDYFPGRQPASSLPHRIYVLTKAMHAKLVQERMEEIQSKVEELTRDEERLLDDNRELAGKSPEDLTGEKATAALKDKEDEERGNAERLDQLAANGEKVLQEALRNKDISAKTLAEWAELMTKLAQLAQGEMQKAAGALQQAREQGKQRAAKLAEAVKLEEEILKALRSSERGMNASIEDMLAQNFVNRLRLAASIENTLAVSLQEMLPQTVGMPLEKLPEAIRGKITGLGARQDECRDLARNVIDDLAGFFNRTRAQRYDAVRKEMTEEKTVEGLAAVAELVRSNVSGEAIEGAGRWKGKLNGWADMLADKKAGGGGSGGGEGGAQLEQSDLEILVSLLRLRRREEDLREQTRLVESSKASNPDYAVAAGKLSAMQRDIADCTRPLERKAVANPLRRLVEKVGGEMMNAAMYLQRPQTDQETVAIENEIIELLSNSIELSCSECEGGGKGAGSGMLALARGKGMGKGAGRNPGQGSMAGGTTDKTNIKAGGASNGTSPGQREVEKGGGLDAGNAPEEFREALESYYRALEKEK